MKGGYRLHGACPMSSIVDDESIDAVCRHMRRAILKHVPIEAKTLRFRWWWFLSGDKMTPAIDSKPDWMSVFSLGCGFKRFGIILIVEWDC